RRFLAHTLSNDFNMSDKHLYDDDGRHIGRISDDSPYSGSDDDNSLDNWTMIVGAVAGALIGLYVGFMGAGVGGAILGLILGPLLGIMAAFIFRFLLIVA